MVHTNVEGCLSIFLFSPAPYRTNRPKNRIVLVYRKQMLQLRWPAVGGGAAGLTDSMHSTVLSPTFSDGSRRATVDALCAAEDSATGSRCISHADSGVGPSSKAVAAVDHAANCLGIAIGRGCRRRSVRDVWVWLCRRGIFLRRGQHVAAGIPMLTGGFVACMQTMHSTSASSAPHLRACMHS